MSNGLPWHVVEKAIKAEQRWLTDVLDFNPKFGGEEDDMGIPGVSKDEMLRQTAISIVGGKIRAREYKTPKINGLWTDDSHRWKSMAKEERHGGDWHKAMMALVRKHFEQADFEVVREPYLNHGRADLGVCKGGHPNLYVEIGTTTLFKVWYNLKSMPNSIFLFVPTVYSAIEFWTE